MKLTSVACIGLQHTTGSRCGTDQGSIVKTRHTTELKVVAPGKRWASLSVIFRVLTGGSMVRSDRLNVPAIDICSH